MGLSNSQYNEIMRIYGEMELDNFYKQKERIENAYRKVPRLRDLDNFMGEESINAASRASAGDKNAIKELKIKLANVIEEKKRLLVEAGFPEDYMDIKYHCPICKDTGYVDNEKCRCFKAQSMKLLYKQSNIAYIVEKQNFDNFDLSIFDNTGMIKTADGSTNREYMADLKEYLLDWTRDFDKKHGNIIFMGTPGTGKTFLVNCISKALMDTYHSVLYLSSTDLFETFSRTSLQDFEEKRDTNDAIMKSDLLVIDDLGTELTNSFTTSKLFYVINQRMVLGKSVIISTNLNFQAMKKLYSDRIVSRIMSEYDIIPLYGRDKRV